MRKSLCAATTLCVLIVIPEAGRAAGRDCGRTAGNGGLTTSAVAAATDGSALCRELQRSVQEALGSSTNIGQNMRAAQSVLRSARGSTSKACEGCIVREVTRTTVPGDQSPCGLHDACVEGDPLDPGSSACVADVCAVRRSCCRTRWDAGCVDLAVSLCALDCGSCTHDACSEGLALPQSCGDCETVVCQSDPFCCDTLWDTQCVDEALASCASPCASASTTVPAPTTTITPTTTATPTTTTTLQCRSTADCTDGNACTTEACLAGVCTSAPLVCDDGNACTADTCDPASGCVFSTISCDDGNSCTTDSCNVASGCVYSSIAGCTPCTDASQCNDSKVCTDDVCTVSGTCSNPTNRVSCDDGNLCTIGDKCLNGSCIGGPIMNCNDGNVCTVDACSSGACNHFTITCSDGNACTTDSCDPVTGCAHQAVNCDDGNPCTTDTCDFVQGCRHAAITGCTP